MLILRMESLLESGNFGMFLVMTTIMGYGVSIKQKSSFEPAGYVKVMAGFL